MSYDLERPRGLLGYMLAFEGVSDSATIVHGPTGCKQYPADLSEKSFRTRDGNSVRDLFSFEERYYFFQPRIPCTYLDGDTFVSGASERLQDLYDLVVSKGPGLIGVINSPGASLIGEDLTKLRSDIPTAVCESPGYSHSMSEGFQDATIEILRTLCKGPVPEKKKGVCILGMGIWQHRWEDSVKEIRRMLGLCGIEVIAAVCAGSSTEEIAKVPSSELNIVISEEFGERVAVYCRESFGTDYVCGYPLGFDAVQDWILDVCERLLVDPTPALKDLECWRHRTAEVVSRLDRSFIDIGGRTFSIDGEGAVVDKATEFLYSYLGLVPVAVSSSDKDKAAYIRARFAMKGIPIADSVWDEEADLCLASGNTISSLKSRRLINDGVDICEPSRMHITVTDEPLLGTFGTVILVQKVLDIVARIIR